MRDLEANALPIAAYCRERGISSWAMYKAARERRADSSSTMADDPSLAEVSIVEANARATTPSAPLEVALPTGLRIHVLVDFDEVTPRRLIGVNRRRDRMKALIREVSGLWLLYERLEYGRFQIFDRDRADVEPSAGSVGDSYDDALAESINSLYKAELIRRKGPWKGIDDVEFATLTWVDWFNNQRLLEPLGYVPPAEFEEMHHLQGQRPAAVAGFKSPSLRRTRDGSQSERVFGPDEQ